MGDRKARLAALAAKAGRTKTLNNSEEVEDDDDNNKKDQQLNENNKRSVSFRNYAPNDTSIDEEGEDKDAKRMRTEEKKSALQEALQEAQSDIATSKGSSSKQQNAITDMAPKKINGDLKRDIQEKLSKLERRTQRAIVELLKERLEREATEETGEGDSDLD